MRKNLWNLGALLALLALGATSPASTVTLSQKEALGKKIAFDTNLSTPAGQACGSCHAENAAFTDPEKNSPTSEGVTKGHFGNRNAPTWAYAVRSPEFHYDEARKAWFGGQFWDGRAKNLQEQAKGPFLNPLEMQNANKAAVVGAVKNGTYAAEFKLVFGPTSLDDPEKAYDAIADAIAAFEASSEVNRYSSRFDAYLGGRTTLAPAEAAGLALFEGKAGCMDCHPSRVGPDGKAPVFTNFGYENLGLPRNPKNPFYALPSNLNADGERWVDVGLFSTVKKSEARGRFKVPTLRNIALTSPYGHNGGFATLTDMVVFLNSRDTSKVVPEVSENVEKKRVGHIGLTPVEVDALVAFLGTLTDG